MDTLEKLVLKPDLGGQLWLLSPNERSVPRRMHRHAELEFNLTVAGKATYILRDRRSDPVCKYPLRRGSLLFLFPEQEHILVDPSDDFSMWIGVISETHVASIAPNLPDGETMVQPYPPLKVGGWLTEQYTTRLERLLTEVNASGLDSGAMRPGLAFSCARAWEFYQLAQELPTGKDVHRAIALAAQLVQQEDAPLSLTELAERVGFSPSHLSKLFHDQTGETISVFRNRQRLNRFLAMHDTDGTLLSRAIDAGFGSYAQFHRVHRELTGRSPSQRS